MSKSESFYLLFLIKMDEKNLKEVVVENEEINEDLLSDEELMYFIENDNQEYYFNEYECLLIDNLY